MKPSPLPRLDTPSEVKYRITAGCRLGTGDIWTDPENGHKVGVVDATDFSGIAALFGNTRAQLVVNDPPYNIAIGNRNSTGLSSESIETYISASKEWVRNAEAIISPDAFLYIWLGADQARGFQPLPDFMIMMREFPELTPRSFITMRNQRGYGTRKNWMFVRQELLCYARGEPGFNVVYTDIPKILRGYYKKVGEKVTENLERSRSKNIRPGNVWVDIQQVFYRMEENVPGAYAQKPIKAIERIITSSSGVGDTVADFFSHSGTTLLAAERSGRRCIICDIDPVFAELTIRRLEHYRKTGRSGWQTENPFPEVEADAY